LRLQCRVCRSCRPGVPWGGDTTANQERGPKSQHCQTVSLDVKPCTRAEKYPHEDKHPRPTNRPRKHPRHHRPQQATNRRARREEPHKDVPHLARGHHGGDEGDGVGHKDASAHAREGPDGDEGVVGFGKGVDEGEDGEEDAPEEGDALVAVDGAEAAADEDEGALGEAAE
jgi:hypothetical protein